MQHKSSGTVAEAPPSLLQTLAVTVHLQKQSHSAGLLTIDEEQRNADQEIDLWSEALRATRTPVVPSVKSTLQFLCGDQSFSISETKITQRATLLGVVENQERLYRNRMAGLPGGVFYLLVAFDRAHLVNFRQDSPLATSNATQQVVLTLTPPAPQSEGGSQFWRVVVDGRIVHRPEVATCKSNELGLLLSSLLMQPVNGVLYTCMSVRPMNETTSAMEVRRRTLLFVATRISSLSPRVDPTGEPQPSAFSSVGSACNERCDESADKQMNSVEAGSTTERALHTEPLLTSTNCNEPLQTTTDGSGANFTSESRTHSSTESSVFTDRPTSYLSDATEQGQCDQRDDYERDLSDGSMFQYRNAPREERCEVFTRARLEWLRSQKHLASLEYSDQLLEQLSAISNGDVNRLKKRDWDRQRVSDTIVCATHHLEVASQLVQEALPLGDAFQRSVDTQEFHPLEDEMLAQLRRLREMLSQPVSEQLYLLVEVDAQLDGLRAELDDDIVANQRKVDALKEKFRLHLSVVRQFHHPVNSTSNRSDTEPILAGVGYPFERAKSAVAGFNVLRVKLGDLRAERRLLLAKIAERASFSDMETTDLEEASERARVNLRELQRELEAYREAQNIQLILAGFPELYDSIPMEYKQFPVSTGMRYDVDFGDFVKVQCLQEKEKVMLVRHRRTAPPLAETEGGELLVLKKFSADPQMKEFLVELDVMNATRGDAYLGTYLYFFKGEGDAYYLAMPHYSCSSTEWARKRLTNKEYAELFEGFAGMARGLSSLHALKIMHGDLKPDNIVFENDLPLAKPKLIDFGISKRFGRETTGQTTTASLRGHTKGFLAPELVGVGGHPSLGVAPTEASDIFAFGMTLSNILARYLAKGNVETQMKEDLGEVRFSSLQRLLDEMTAVDPSSRPQSALEIANRLLSIAENSRGSFASACFVK
jgi:hypothetical protein